MIDFRKDPSPTSGKPAKVARCAAARKLLHLAFAVGTHLEEKVTLLLSHSQAKEGLLPKEALGEGGNEANFDEEAHNGFYRGKSSIGIA